METRKRKDLSLSSPNASRFFGFVAIIRNGRNLGAVLSSARVDVPPAAMRDLNRSMGAVQVREIAPATNPANKISPALLCDPLFALTRRAVGGGIPKGIAFAMMMNKSVYRRKKFKSRIKSSPLFELNKY